MIFLPNGTNQFEDMSELMYYLLSELRLAINANNRIYDMDSKIELRYTDKYIKTAVTNIPIYAGKDDIILDINSPLKLIMTLFGYFIDKYSSDEENEFSYISDFKEQIEDMVRLIVRTNKGDIASNYHHNLNLCYIEMIFLINQNYLVDLSNFDIVEQPKKKGK